MNYSVNFYEYIMGHGFLAYCMLISPQNARVFRTRICMKFHCVNKPLYRILHIFQIRRLFLTQPN